MSRGLGHVQRRVMEYAEAHWDSDRDRRIPVRVSDLYEAVYGLSWGPTGPIGAMGIREYEWTPHAPTAAMTSAIHRALKQLERAGLLAKAPYSKGSGKKGIRRWALCG
jgi:hypothetical protein